MMRFGVATRLIGRGAPAGLPRGAHLSRGLVWLREVLEYLMARRISFYRIPLVLAGNNPSDIRRALGESGALIAELRTVLVGNMRLTAHIPPGLGPASERSESLERWAGMISCQAQLLVALGTPEAVVVSHMGGAAGGRVVALERAARHILRLPGELRAWLAIEVDEDSYSLHELLWLHAACGVSVVFDSLHHQINNPDRIPLDMALRLACATWPHGIRPKIHLSSQRTEAHVLPGARGAALRVVPPAIGQHADFINPFEASRLIEASAGLAPFDIMIEAKAGDLALLRLREDLRRYIPEATNALG